GGAVGDGAGMRPAVRDPARRARDRRAARPAVRGESHEPVLLLQVGAVVEADGAGGGTWLCGGGGRLERGWRRGLASGGARRGRVGHPVAARGGRSDEGGHPRAVAAPWIADLGPAGRAVSREPDPVWARGHP